MILAIILFFVAMAYVSLIITFTIGLKRALNKKYDDINERIKINVVVPFRNEESNLPVLLDSLLNQILSQEFFELILVDDHSTDSSLSIAQSYSAKFQSLRVIKLPAEINGKKAALNFGIGLASNPYIVTTDADCSPSEFWLETISKLFATNSDFIIGAVAMHPINSFAKKIQSLEYSSLMATAVGSFGIGHPVIASSANLAFQKDLLSIDSESMNPAVTSGDDMFLLHKAKRLKDCKIVFLNDSRSIVYTSTEPSIANALKQRKRWASKSFYYKDFDTIASGLVVMIFNLSLIALLFASVIDVKLLIYFFTLLVLKTLVDYLLINRYLKFTGQGELLKVFLPLQLMYPFYISYSFFAGVFTKTAWKGRSINK
jgi:poly-beta-1,6-N-acetyl-D-glucosamine synthase